MNQIQFYIKSSNSLNALAGRLISEVANRPADVFTPLNLITQTEGMNNWLREKIAEETGIAANIEFLKLNDLLHKIYRLAGGTFQRSLSATDLSWILYDLLGDETIIRKFPGIAGYYFENHKQDRIKRMELARKAADLFDQYQAYRPDMLEQWEKGKFLYDSEEEKWQMELWLLAKSKAGKLFPDKSAVRRYILEKINDPEIVKNIERQIPCIYIFGTVLLTAYHRDLLFRISEKIPVYIFLPNPAPEIYWYEDQNKKQLFYQKKRNRTVVENSLNNPLLLNWGKLIQNTFYLLFENDSVINLYESIDPTAFTGDSLLHRLQFYISENSVPATDEYFSEKLLTDHSLTIQSCHSPLREIQTLYNYLVRLTDTHPGKINARDIVVQVTEIDRYASYIRAVFDNAPYQFPYKIADETFIASDSLSKALSEILTIDPASFSSETVMQLLDFSCIRSRFKIYDTDRMRTIVEAANIRHGIDGSYDNDSVYVSWVYGLKRILFGICIIGEEEYGTGRDSFFPLDLTEGMEAEEVIHLTYFIDTLLSFVRDRNRDRTIREWIEYVFDVMQKLIFNEEEQDSEEYRQLIETVENSASAEDLFTEKIQYNLFLKQLLPAIGDAIQEYHFARGGVTFCSMIPMRSIPFKVVAMLGLDFDKFPRKNNPSGFDIMVKFPRHGDRNLKVHDKHLFLETIMSAGEYLYLSYTGQDIQSNTMLPPSALIDELLSFISDHSQGNHSITDLLVVRQPLHSFSRLYGMNNKYYNYLLTPAVHKDIRAARKESLSNEVVLTLASLISFYKDPVKWYFTRVLKIHFEEADIALPETELFSLNNLEKWSLKNKWLKTDDKDTEAFYNHQIKTGGLPFKNYGKLELEDVVEEMKKIKDAFLKLSKGEAGQGIHLSVPVKQGILSGNIEFVFENHILIPCFSKNENKYLFSAYLTALMVFAAGYEKDVIFVSNNIQKAERISQAIAIKQLNLLIDYFVQGSERILSFFIDVSLDPDEIIALDQKKFSDRIKKDYNNAYSQKLSDEGFFDTENVLEEYKTIASKILPGLKTIFKG